MAVAMKRWPLCRGERPAFLYPFLALAVFTSLPRCYNKQAFLREGCSIGMGLLRSAAAPPVRASGFPVRERATKHRRTPFLLSWHCLVSLFAVLLCVILYRW